MKSIQKQTIYSSILGYAGIAIGFISQGIFVFRYFEKEENGLILVILAIANPLAILSNLGVNGAGSRFFPYFRNEEKKHNGFLKLTLIVSFVGFLLVSFLVMFFKANIENYFIKESPLIVEYFYLILPITFFLLLFAIFENYTKVLYDTIASTLLQSFLLRILNLILILLTVYGFINFKEYINYWPFTYVIIAIFLVLVVIFRKQFFWKNSIIKFEDNTRNQFLKFSIISVMTSLSSQVVFQIDKIMVSAYQGLQESGIYGVAFLFGTVIAFPSAALVKSSSIYIAEAWKSNDYKTILRLYKNSCIIQFLTGVLVFLGLLCNFHGIFQVITKYTEAEVETIFILIGLTKLVDMASGINGVIISTSKYYFFDTITFFLLSGVTIALNHWLIPIYGLNGAGFAALITMILYNSARFYFLYYKYEFQPFNLNFVKVVFIGLFVYFLNFISPKFDNSISQIVLDLLIRSILICTIFLGLIYAFKVSEETNGFLRNGLKKLFLVIKK